MKLAHKDLEGYFDYRENNIYTLTIENKEKFRKFVDEINDQINTSEGDFLLSEKDKEINLGKNTFIIFDYINLQTSTSFQKQIIKGLENLYKDTDLEAEINEMKISINTSLQKLLIDYDYDLETEIIEIEDLLKNLKPKLKINKNFQIDLLSYLRFINNELKYKLIVLINLKTYLTKEEIDQFIYQLKVENINTLLVESTYIKNQGEERIIIDQDLCQINS